MPLPPAVPYLITAYNHVDVSAEASVSRSWDKLYTLSLNDSKTTLGKQTVIYEPSSGA